MEHFPIRTDLALESKERLEAEKNRCGEWFLRNILMKKEM